jgi:lipopolysaccharide biosynthesis glycosyltransferase
VGPQPLTKGSGWRGIVCPNFPDNNGVVSLEPLVIACAADYQYGLPLATMLKSAALNLDPERPMDVYIADGGLDSEMRMRVSASLPERVALHWMAPDRTGFIDLPLWGRMTIATYDKMTVGRWLPASVQRALWLDGDLMVLRDLTHLWKAAATGYCAMAVQDVLVQTVGSRFGIACHRELGIDSGAEYFNAGVMLIDVTRWRHEDVAGQALSYLRHNARRVFFWDQEALNATLAGRWKKLDPRWNRNAGWERTETSAQDSTWIVHFTGSLKPWHFQGRSPSHQLYYQYVDSTAWAGWRPARTWRNVALSRYESSRLRHLLLPLECLAMAAQRAMTLRYVSADLRAVAHP